MVAKNFAAKGGIPFRITQYSTQTKARMFYFLPHSLLRHAHSLQKAKHTRIA